MIDYILSNIDWLLSGVLVTVPLTIVTIYLTRKQSIKKKFITQTQVSKGKSTRNFQSGRDININK
jgi:hypothetical protein